MFPFQISDILTISPIDEKLIDIAIIGNSSGRKVKKIKRGIYEVDEPTPFFGIALLYHEIRIKEDKIVFNSTCAIAAIISVVFTIFIALAIINIYIDKGKFDYEFLFLLPVGWIVFPAFLYIPYLFYLPTKKKLKALIEEKTKPNNSNRYTTH